MRGDLAVVFNVVRDHERKFNNALCPTFGALDLDAQWIARKFHAVVSNVRQTNDEIVERKIDDVKFKSVGKTIPESH